MRFRLFKAPIPLLSPQICSTRKNKFSLFRRLENQPLKPCSSSSARRVDIFRGVEHQNRTIFSRDTTFTTVRDIRVHLNICNTITSFCNPKWMCNTALKKCPVYHSPHKKHRPNTVWRHHQHWLQSKSHQSFSSSSSTSIWMFSWSVSSSCGPHIFF